MKKNLIIIPTYNEKSNIKNLINNIFKYQNNFDLVMSMFYVINHLISLDELIGFFDLVSFTFINVFPRVIIN